MHLIRIKLEVYLEPKRIPCESKHSPNDKQTSRKKTLKFPSGIPEEYKKYKQKTTRKNVIENVSSIHKRIRKS